jgi:CheY-like chemotaxis protein
MVIILTQDLMMSSSAGAVARANSVTLKTVASAAKAIEWLREHQASLLLVDLQLNGLNLDELTAGIGDLPDASRPHSIAYAQHVNVELLQQGQQAGFDEVVTRGQMNRGLGELLTRYGTVGS